MEEVGTTILSQQHCHLGEGCTFDPATGTAWWFDILERTLFQADLERLIGKRPWEIKQAPRVEEPVTESEENKKPEAKSEPAPVIPPINLGQISPGLG